MANRAPACNVHYVGGSQAIVTVNNGSRCGDRVNQTAAQPAIRHVTVTPLSPPNTGQPRITLPNSTPIALRKLLIKAVHKGEKEKKDSGKIFTLRNINPVSVSKVEDLKSLIKAQLGNDLVDRFDIGHVQNNKVISLRSKEDIADLMSSVQKGENILLWCDGLRKEPEKKNLQKRGKSKSSTINDSDSDDEDPPGKRKKEDRDDKVQRRIEELKEMHGQSTYTSMQYRIWAELLSGGVYSSTSEAPTQSTMFMRAGSGGMQKKKGHSGASGTQATSTSCGTSPAKLIENRSKCYKQLADLNSLKQSGLLSDAEYTSEREAVMNMLKKMSN